MFKRNIFFLSIIGIYLLFINIMASIPNLNLDYENVTGGTSSQFVNADFGHYVEITVERNRFYGHIVENGQISNLYVLKFIKIPLKSENWSFRGLNMIFFGFLSVLYLAVLFSVMKSKRERRWAHEKNL